MRLLAVSLLSCLSAVAFGQANNNACNDKILEQLRTISNENTGSTVTDVVQNLACTQSQNATGGSYMSYGFSHSEQQQACNKKDRSFFETHSRELAMNYMPDSAMATVQAICGVPRGLTLESHVSGNLIHLNAKFNTGNDGTENPIVKAFSYSPRDVVSCSKEIRAGVVINGPGTPNDCTRIRPGEVEFSLLVKDRFTGQSRGSAYLYVPAVAAAKPGEWIFDINDVTHEDAHCSLDGVSVGSVTHTKEHDSWVVRPKREGELEVYCAFTNPPGQSNGDNRATVTVRRNGVLLIDHSTIFPGGTRWSVTVPHSDISVR